MATRVALLEQIVQTDRATFARVERQLEVIADQQRADFRWLPGVMLGGFGLMLGSFGTLLGVMAHGFHWL